MWGVLRSADGARPSLVQDALQGNLDILTTPGIGRRCEVRKDDSDGGLEPVCAGECDPVPDGAGCPPAPQQVTPRPPRQGQGDPTLQRSLSAPSLTEPLLMCMLLEEIGCFI